MNDIRSLRWPLVLGLGALALVRPLVSIVEFQLDVDAPPVVPIGITVLVSAVWIAVVGVGRVAHPVLTLLCTGLTYGVLAIVLSGILSPLLTGELQGPLAVPLAIVPVLLVNALWGATAGGLALLVQRLRGVRPDDPVASRRPASPPGSVPPPRPPRSAWQSAGIGALGLVGGVLTALVVQDLLAVAFLRDGRIPTPLAVVLGVLLPAFGAVGAVAAVLIDRRRAGRRSRSTTGG